jgi:hypothetical protein
MPPGYADVPSCMPFVLTLASILRLYTICCILVLVYIYCACLSYFLTNFV